MGYSIWTAPSDLDYYYDAGLIEDEEFFCDHCEDHGCPECSEVELQCEDLALGEEGWAALLASVELDDDTAYINYLNERAAESGRNFQAERWERWA